MALAVFLMLVCNVIGGLTYPWQKEALKGLPPATISVIRTLLALACMAAWLLAKRRGLKWPWNRSETKRLAVVATLGMACPLLLGIYGVQRSTAANGAILILLEPVSILVFSHLLLGEKVGGLRGAGVALGCAGAILVVVGDMLKPESGMGKLDLADQSMLIGNLMLAASAICWGLYSPVIAPLTKKHGSMELSYALFLMSQAVFIPLALSELPQVHAGPKLVSSIAYALVLGVFASFLGTVLWNESLRTLPAPVVAPFVLLQPAVGAVGAVYLLGEKLSPWAVGGAVLAGAGVVLVLIGERRAAVSAGG